MKKLLFCLMAMCMMLFSCNMNNTQTQQQEQEVVENTNPFNFLEEPQEIETSLCFTVFNTLGENYGLAEGLPEIAVVVCEDTCYDDMQICATDSMAFYMIGTYSYQSRDSLHRTVPVLRLFEREEEIE